MVDILCCLKEERLGLAKTVKEGGGCIICLDLWVQKEKHVGMEGFIIMGTTKFHVMC